MPGALSGVCGYQGFGESFTSFFCNAASGNLSASQVTALKADAASQVRHASAGMQPQAQDVLVQKALNDIDLALATFKMPGETGADVGAAPGQAGFRLPGTGVLDLSKINKILPSLPNLANLKWWILAAGILAGAFYAFPYIAPGLAKNIKAFKRVRG
jgi:hypothetical protein